MGNNIKQRSEKKFNKNMEKDKVTYSEHYNGYLTEKNNYVWGGAMCLAWTELKNNIIKEPIKLNTSDPKTLQMIQNFNSSTFSEKDIDPACVYIKSGIGKKTMDLINFEVKKKFPQKTTPPLDLDMKEDSIISYAYLLKKLSFITKFERLPDKNFLFNNEHNCDAFYAEKKDQRRQIYYSHYNNRDDFAITIKSKNPNDLLILVKSEKQLTIEQVLKHCDSEKLIPIGSKDEFMMPVIDLDLKHSIDQLKLGVLNEKFQGYYIQEIFENLKLKIDESGAKVENEAVITMNKCMPMPVQIKEFILDKPFWVVMRQVGKHPYLAIYVRNPIQTQ